MVIVQKIARLLLLGGKIERRFVVRVDDFDQQHLRALQVPADRNQSDALRITQVFSGIFVARQVTSCDEREDKKQSHRPRQCPLRRSSEPSATLFRQPITDVQPGFLLENRRRFRHFDGSNVAQEPLHALKLAAAPPARRQMQADLVFAIGVAVVMENDLFFAQVIHRATLANGSSCRRNFRTARKIVFLAALFFSFSVWLISSTERPSIWRMVNATRSTAVSRPRACVILAFISALRSMRSGPG